MTDVSAANHEAEVDRVRGILRDHDLNDQVTITIGTPPHGMDAAFEWVSRRIVVRAGAPTLTVCHEGAHAEHCLRSDVDPQALLKDAATHLGVLLSTEAYVGRRLATVDGFIAAERSAVASIPSILPGGFPATVGKWAFLKYTPHDVAGDGFNGTAFSVDGVRVVMRVLPLVVAEQLSNDVVFSGDLYKNTGKTGDVLLKVLRSEVDFVKNEADLLSMAKMAEVGQGFIELFRKRGIPL
jgi:hypothetical protein